MRPRPRPPLLTASLALALVAAGCSRSKPASFVDTLLASVPEPAAAAFPTPELLVTRFFEAVNAGDADGALRCFPIRAYHAAYDVETHFAETGSWNLNQMGVPAPPGVDALGEGLAALFIYAEPYSRFRRLALAASNPDLGSRSVLDSDTDWRTELDAVKALRITRSYSVTVTEVRDEKLSPLDLAMKVEARRSLFLEVKLGEGALRPQAAAVVKLGDGWRLLTLGTR